MTKKRTRNIWEPVFEKPPGRVLCDETKTVGNNGIGHRRVVSRKGPWVYEYVRQTPRNRSLPDVFYRRHVPGSVADPDAAADRTYGQTVWNSEKRAWLSASPGPHVKKGSEEWHRIMRACGLRD